MAHGVPVAVQRQANFEAEWERGNYPLESRHVPVFDAKVLDDITLGRCVVLHASPARQFLSNRLHINPVFVVDEGATKFRVVHDLSAMMHGESVNNTTVFEDAPVVECGHIFAACLYRIWSLRQKWPDKRILISKMDVKSAFRQIPLDLTGPLLGYRYKDLVVVDLRLQFGWRSSPGWWSLAGGAIEWSVQQDSPSEGPFPGKVAADFVSHVTVVQSASNTMVAVPLDERAKRRLKGGARRDPVWARMYVDDLIMVMVEWEQDLLLAVTRSAAHAHFRLLGEPQSGTPPAISQNKVTNWDTTMTVLGWEVDTVAMLIRMPANKRSSLLSLLELWQPDRQHAQRGELWVLLGKLSWAAHGVTAGKFFLWRLRGVLRGGQPTAKSSGRGLVVLSVEALKDLVFWRWAVGPRVGAAALSKPISAIVKRKADRQWWSDASHDAVGGFCETTGVWWRYDLTAEQRTRLNKGTKVQMGDGSIHINLLELLGMVMTAWVVVVVEKQTPTLTGETVLLRGDNTSAVGWVEKGGGASDPRSGGLLRLLGALELSGGWSFGAQHVPGKLNQIADGISRWDIMSVQAELQARYPHVRWRQSTLGQHEGQIITAALAKSWPETAWEQRLWASITQRGLNG